MEITFQPRGNSFRNSDLRAVPGSWLSNKKPASEARRHLLANQRATDRAASRHFEAGAFHPVATRSQQPQQAAAKLARRPAWLRGKPSTRTETRTRTRRSNRKTSTEFEQVPRWSLRPWETFLFPKPVLAVARVSLEAEPASSPW